MIHRRCKLRHELTQGPKDGEEVQRAHPSNNLEPLHAEALGFRGSAWLTWLSNTRTEIQAPSGEDVSSRILYNVCLKGNLKLEAK